MEDKWNQIIIRRSIAILLLEIATLQILAIIGYLILRLSKFWFLREVIVDTDFGDIEFWLGILVFALIVGLQSLYVFALVLRWWYEYYDIREESITHIWGVLKRREDIYSLKNIEAGNVTQTLAGKVLNFGTISIYSPVLKKEYFIRDVSSPNLIKRSIIELISNPAEDNEEKIIPRDISKI